jgi:hypothetical protein
LRTREKWRTKGVVCAVMVGFKGKVVNYGRVRVSCGVLGCVHDLESDCGGRRSSFRIVSRELIVTCEGNWSGGGRRRGEGVGRLCETANQEPGSSNASMRGL